MGKPPKQNRNQLERDIPITSFVGPWLALLIWLGLIYYFSASPVGSSGFTGKALSALAKALLPPQAITWIGDNLPTNTFRVLHWVVRKGAHVVVFGVLGLLMWWALLPRRWAPVAAWALTTFVAVADEWHQAHVPGRTGSATDVALNSSAALLVVALAVLLRRRRGR